MTIAFRVAVTALLAVAVITVNGSVDEFQCVCAHNVWLHGQKAVSMIEHSDGRVLDEIVKFGALVSRMLLVANKRPEPTTRWLWLLNMYTNAVRQRFARPDDKTIELLSDGAELIGADLNPYLQLCNERHPTTGSDWTLEAFEKYILENMTEVIQKPDSKDYPIRETDFDPRCLYLNDVAANGTGVLSEMLVQDIGIDWKNTASELSHIYNLSKKYWVFGTRELVLYQRKFLSTVAASLMGYVLIHVTYCKERWQSNSSDGLSNDNSLVGEYERMWMSVGGLLDKFKSYFALDSEKYFKTLTEIAVNPLWDEQKFQAVKHTIRTNIIEIGRGLFGPKDIKVKVDGDKHKPLNELIALIDNNISSAETYLQTIKNSLTLDVNFKIIKNFMRSTHIWLV